MVSNIPPLKPHDVVGWRVGDDYYCQDCPPVAMEKAVPIHAIDPAWEDQVCATCDERLRFAVYPD